MRLVRLGNCLRMGTDERQLIKRFFAAGLDVLVVLEKNKYKILNDSGCCLKLTRKTAGIAGLNQKSQQ